MVIYEASGYQGPGFCSHCGIFASLVHQRHLSDVDRALAANFPIQARQGCVTTAHAAQPPGSSHRVSGPEIHRGYRAHSKNDRARRHSQPPPCAPPPLRTATGSGSEPPSSRSSSRSISTCASCCIHGLLRRTWTLRRGSTATLRKISRPRSFRSRSILGTPKSSSRTPYTMRPTTLRNGTRSFRRAVTVSFVWALTRACSACPFSTRCTA